MRVSELVITSNNIIKSKNLKYEYVNINTATAIDKLIKLHLI